MLQYHKKRPWNKKSLLKIINYLWSMAVRIMRSQEANSFGKVMKSKKIKKYSTLLTFVIPLVIPQKHLWRRVLKKLSTVESPWNTVKTSMEESYEKKFEQLNRAESPCDTIKCFMEESFEKYLGWEALSYHNIELLQSWQKVLQSGTGFCYYNVGQLVLQSGVGCIITKWDNFISMWDGCYKVGQFYYKMGQLLQSGPLQVLRINSWSYWKYIFGLLIWGNYIISD